MKTLLIITDGIGHNESSEANAFALAKKPFYDRAFREIPHTLIHTYGDFVGLPDGQMGNSEIGHMCMGSGRVLYTDLVKINLAIKNQEIAQNAALAEFKNCKKIHIIGLCSDGGVHSHISHIFALAQNAMKNGSKVFLHLITDGRDVAPQSAKDFIKEAMDFVANSSGQAKIASICGRFYAMDRDRRWERIQKAWECFVLANAPRFESGKELEYLEEQYKKGIFDEFVEPAVFGDFSGICAQKDSIKTDSIKSNIQKEGIIFANFRSDRAREICAALGLKDFVEFDRANYIPPKLACLTEYDASFPFPILFPKQLPQNTLAEVISKAGLRQFHTAETEKYAHITFFFNGGVEAEFKGERRLLVPSPKVKTYDLQPQMSAPAVSAAVCGAIRDEYDFIVVNFANGDMVGHTGNLEAAIKAVEAVDTELGKIWELAKQNNYAIILTSDHGNCEKMKDEFGNVLTNHTVGDVWCFVDALGVKDLKKDCSLNNIAASVLELMGLQKPKEMDDGLF